MLRINIHINCLKYNLYIIRIIIINRNINLSKDNRIERNLLHIIQREVNINVFSSKKSIDGAHP
jgi:hypothetical protein